MHLLQHSMDCSNSHANNCHARPLVMGLKDLDWASWRTNIQLVFVGGRRATSFPIYTPVLAGLSRDGPVVTQHTAHLLLSGLSVSVHKSRLSTSFLLLFSVLSLEQMQHRSGMVRIGIERCWGGDNNSYHLRLLACHGTCATACTQKTTYMCKNWNVSWLFLLPVWNLLAICTRGNRGWYQITLVIFLIFYVVPTSV